MLRFAKLIVACILLVHISAALAEDTCTATSARRFTPSSPEERAWLRRTPSVSTSTPLTSNSAIVELTDGNAEPVLSKVTAFVAFYTPWAGEWREVRKEFQALAEEMRANGSNIIFATANCAVQHGIRNMYLGLVLYPRIVYFSLGVPVPFTGLPRVQQMASFIKRAEQLFVRELHSISDVRAFLLRDEMAVVGLFPPSPQWMVWRKDPNVEQFQQSMNTGLYTFSHSSIVRNGSVLHQFGVPLKTGGIILQDRGHCYVKQPDLPKAELQAWLEGAYNDRLLYFSRPDNIASLVHGSTFVWLFREMFEDFETLRLVSERFGSDVRFLVLDGLRYPSFGLQAGLPRGMLPAGVLLSEAKHRYYPFKPKSKLDTEELTDFLDRCLDENEDAHVRMEDPLPPQHVNEATLLREIISPEKASKNISVLFYQPWHGGSKAALMLWDSIDRLKCSAEMLKLNLRNSDPIDGIGVRVFPTVLTLPAGERTQPVSFTGPWRLPDLRKFVCP